MKNEAKFIKNALLHTHSGVRRPEVIRGRSKGGEGAGCKTVKPLFYRQWQLRHVLSRGLVPLLLFEQRISALFINVKCSF